jgi:hypothetical protein
MLESQNLLDVESVLTRPTILRDPVNEDCRFRHWGFIPFSKRSSKGIETFANRFVQYGLIWRYSIFLVPAMI